MTIFILYAFWVIVGAAAVQDMAKFKISNWFTIALIALFFVRIGVVGPSLDLWQNLLVFVLTMGIGFFLFTRSIIGAGDVKLLASIALWFDMAGAARLLGWIALMGGLLALMLILVRRLIPSTLRDRLGWKIIQKGGPIPYGIAIAGGAIVASINVGFHPFR